MYPRYPSNTLFIPRILDQFDVLTALGSEQRQQRGRIRPEYATAVFVAYIQAKLAKGRTKHEVSLKVQDLERGLPHLAGSFVQARQVTGLPPSPLFPPPRTDPTGGTSQLALLRTQSAYHSPQHSLPGGSTVQSPGMRRASTATSRPYVAPVAQPATLRPTEEGSELPPPPYSRQDPEPEATAELTRQISQLTTGPSLAAPIIPATPVAPSTSVDSNAEERERRELEEALRLSRESAEEEEAMRLSRESAEAEQARWQFQEEQSHLPGSSATAPPPLPARAAPPAVSLLDSPSTAIGTLAAPLNPIRTGSNNPFASALDAEADSQVQGGTIRYAPPPGPPPNHNATHTPSTGSAYAPPPGPPPGHSAGLVSANPFINHSRSVSSGSTPSPSASHFPSADISILAKYDTIILIDDSGSMAGGRWQQVRVALMDVATRVARVDEDGIEVHFVNSMVEGYNLTTAGSVEKLFNKVKPTNGTPTGAALRRILEPYMDQLEHVQQLKANGEQIPVGEDVKPVNVIVLTDGAATDDPESVIVSVASRLDRGGFPLNQLGIQFLQIGNEPEAREALQALDDGIKERHEVRDIVDTVVYHGDGAAVSAEQILKVLLGGIQKHLDEQDVPQRREGFV
ncbi:hypothetical protein QFC22_006239 [Naganishia vaughanmartiniae]|uniref:Uncharacterized protein n=1 Tax=Naganishia vaughanmartiniae TaxID=1424756 RepID=A0ACC2WNV1_9TREE|nr:hypothetical protein QFC22_006239 [Naganishia vaughanmartiniae]